MCEPFLSSDQLLKESFYSRNEILTVSCEVTSSLSLLPQDGRQLQNIVNMRGVALVASSPVQHDSPVQHPIEVQSYRPPWKAFADYALHHDLDPNAPHFQHLVNQVSPARIDRSRSPNPCSRANTRMAQKTHSQGRDQLHV